MDTGALSWVSGQTPQCPRALLCWRQIGMLGQKPLHDPGEMYPWICTVASVMSDVWGPAQDSNKQPTGRASKAHLSLISPSHHSHSLHSSSHTSPSLSSLAALPHAPLPMGPPIASLPLHLSILPPLLPTLPSPLAVCPNSTSEVIFLECKSQQKQVNNLKQSGPFLSSYTCLPLN